MGEDHLGLTHNWSHLSEYKHASCVDAYCQHDRLHPERDLINVRDSVMLIQFPNQRTMINTARTMHECTLETTRQLIQTEDTPVALHHFDEIGREDPHSPVEFTFPPRVDLVALFRDSDDLALLERQITGLNSIKVIQRNGPRHALVGK